MEAPALSSELEIMPAQPSPEQPGKILPRKIATNAGEQFRMIPVLLVAATAAWIAVFPLSAKVSFALLCSELGMWFLSIAISLPHGKKY
jgi:hypothetical protein